MNSALLELSFNYSGRRPITTHNQHTKSGATNKISMAAKEIVAPHGACYTGSGCTGSLLGDGPMKMVECCLLKNGAGWKDAKGNCHDCGDIERYSRSSSSTPDITAPPVSPVDSSPGSAY